MSLTLALIAAVGVGLFARLVKNRSAVFWSVGTFAVIALGEIPLRAAIVGQHPPEAVALAVALVLGGFMLLMAAGTRKLPPEKPAGDKSLNADSR